MNPHTGFGSVVNHSTFFLVRGSLSQTLPLTISWPISASVPSYLFLNLPYMPCKCIPPYEERQGELDLELIKRVKIGTLSVARSLDT